jgi:hypothetical protein
MTENGATYFDISKYSEDESSTIYRLFTLKIYSNVEIPKGLLGDVNGDGLVNVIDATTIQKYIVNQTKLSSKGLILADVDGNGVVNIVDATSIQKHSIGMNTSYPIGQPI